jgi:hypothetical protein
VNIGAATGTLTVANTTLAAKAITASTTLGVTGATTLSSTLSLGGTVSGGGNQINNVVIGTTTPLAGNFTTLSATGTLSGGTSGTGYSFSGSAPAGSLALDSSGNLGIGVSSPLAVVDVLGAFFNGGSSRTNSVTKTFGFRVPHFLTATNPMNVIGGLSTTSNNIVYIGGSDANIGGTAATDLLFYTAANNTTANGTLRMTLDSSGNLLVGVTSANANGGVLQLKSGITFPATAVAATDANTLDDYEEGTWTPVLTGDTSSTGITYGGQVGRYVKIGNLVTVDISLVLATKTSIVGNVIITGVPYTAHTTPNTAVTWGYWSNLAANWMSVGGWLNGGNIIYLGGRKTAGSGIETMLDADIASNTQLNCSVTYKVA